MTARRILPVALMGSFVAVLMACTRIPSGSPPVPILLRQAPADLGCDAITVPYRSIVIRIDPAAPDQVTAATESGAVLETYWDLGFVGGTSMDLVVRDPNGQIVARHGQRLDIPERQWPRLGGYFVCASRDAIYVLLDDPQ